MEPVVQLRRFTTGKSYWVMERTDQFPSAAGVSVGKEETNIIIKNFIKEIKLLSEQRHPNIVQFLGVADLDGAHGGNVSLVMEHIDEYR